VLALSAFLCVPRQTLLSVGIGLGAGAAAGFAYVCAIAASLLHRMRGYVPVKEDWIWYVALPALTYAALGWMAWLIQDRPELAEYGIGAVTFSFLFIGIHNAWDIAAYVSLHKHDEPAKDGEIQEKGQSAPREIERS
jgi:hypothetical protein